MPISLPEYVPISLPEYAPWSLPEYAPTSLPEYAPISLPEHAPISLPDYASISLPESYRCANISTEICANTPIEISANILTRNMRQYPYRSICIALIFICISSSDNWLHSLLSSIQIWTAWTNIWQAILSVNRMRVCAPGSSISGHSYQTKPGIYCPSLRCKYSVCMGAKLL